MSQWDVAAANFTADDDLDWFRFDPEFPQCGT